MALPLLGLLLSGLMAVGRGLLRVGKRAGLRRGASGKSTSGSKRSVHFRTTISGPLFSPNRQALVLAAMSKSMKAAVLLGERNIKSGYVRSPSPNVVGGRKTSHLSRGVRGKVISPFQAMIAPGRYVYGSDVPYAGIVEFGRRASGKIVKPRRGKALRFKPRGSSTYIFRRSTQPFLQPLKGNPMFTKTTTSRSYNTIITKIFSRNIKKALT